MRRWWNAYVRKGTVYVIKHTETKVLQARPLPADPGGLSPLLAYHISAIDDTRSLAFLADHHQMAAGGHLILGSLGVHPTTSRPHPPSRAPDAY